MILKSYAKINLYLQLCGKNKFNYHLLDSLFAYTSLYDLLELEKSYKDDHQIIANYDLELTENIIYKSFKVFEQKYNLHNSQKFTVKQHKNIPIGAGLGGGSSNAAAILNFLYKFYGIAEDLQGKINLALELGADLPFFCTPYSKYVTGIGEEFGRNVTFPDLPLIIVKPPANLLTKDVFSKVSRKDYSGNLKHKPSDLSKLENFWQLLAETKNDLTNVATSLCPELEQLLAIAEQDADVIGRLTGSGPSCYFLCKTDEKCESLYQEIKQNFPDYYIYEGFLREAV